MKKIILLLLLFSVVINGNAQNKYLVDEHGKPKHYLISRKWSKNNIYMLVDGQTRSVNVFKYLNNYPDANAALLTGAKTIELETQIQKDSLSFYRYSIVIDDSIKLKDKLIPTKIKSVSDLDSNKLDKVTIDLGTFDVANKKLLVSIYKIGAKTKNETSVVIYNKSIMPPKITSITLVDKNGNQMSIKDGGKISISKEIGGIRVTMQKTNLDEIYDVVLENVDGHGTNWLGSRWKNKPGTNTSVFSVDLRNFDNNGNYKLSVSPKIDEFGMPSEKLAAIFKFSVKKTEEKRFSTKQLITSGLLFALIAGAITGGLAVYFKNQQIKKKVAAEAKQKEIAQLQLNSVRSQLNPHFLFNALAGIQNLMNKNEIDNANRYLSKFARLTRNVLDSKELISLTEEKILLDDYLQMEQLRFGFQYNINASADLDTENIEIPAMLLQPFVENAVKHGIAEKGKDGEIAVSFEKQVSDLVLKITDNGSGFDATQTYDGLGLALSKNRISLLNTVYKDTPFILNIQSDTNGTTVTITLSQWL